MTEAIRVRLAGGDDVVGVVVGTETHDPDGHELIEPMIWVQWPDIDGFDLLTWDDVVQA